MAKNVIGLFDDHLQAEAAVNDLVAAGFDKGCISALAAETEGSLLEKQVDANTDSVGESAATGLTSGAIIGGLLGLLIGAGYLAIPIGLAAAGPLAGLIAGSAAGAATGGVVGALMGLGVPEEDAHVYAEGVRRGAMLVVVEADEADVDRVHAIMNRDGAIDIEDRGYLYRDKRRDHSATVEELEEEERAEYAATGGPSQRIRIYTSGQEAPPVTNPEEENREPQDPSRGT